MSRHALRLAGAGTPAEAIRSATLGAAALLGVDDRGSLEAGKLADVVAVAGDPLADVAALAAPRFVRMGGKVLRWGELVGGAEGLPPSLLRAEVGAPLAAPAVDSTAARQRRAPAPRRRARQGLAPLVRIAPP